MRVRESVGLPERSDPVASPTTRDGSSALEPLQEARTRPGNLLREETIQRWHPEPTPVVETHRQLTCLIHLCDLRVEDPCGMLPVVLLSSFEADVTGAVLCAHHAEPLGPRERSKSPA